LNNFLNINLNGYHNIKVHFKVINKDSKCKLIGYQEKMIFQKDTRKDISIQIYFLMNKYFQNYKKIYYIKIFLYHNQSVIKYKKIYQIE
jgi:hypothetical protein